MRIDTYTRIALTAIAFFLAVIALRPLFTPVPASAQSISSSIYIEPGTQMLRSPDGLRQVWGRVVVDLRTGKIWGYPTGTTDTYPVSLTTSQPPTSTPFLLGKLDLSVLVE